MLIIFKSEGDGFSTKGSESEFSDKALTYSIASGKYRCCQDLFPLLQNEVFHVSFLTWEFNNSIKRAFK